jgi:hypothetical protein
MGFIGYLVEYSENPVVRVFMECNDEPGEREAVPGEGISYTYAVDVIFPNDRPPCRLSGLDDILSLKKFYKVISSLEERAREHGNSRQAPLESIGGFVEHLRYTRNARDLAGVRLSRRLPDREDADTCDIAVS